MATPIVTPTVDRRENARQRSRRWRVVSRRIRQAIWRLRGADDLEELLAEIRIGLLDLDMPLSSCGVNVIDLTVEPAAVTAHSLSRKGERYRLQSFGAGVVIGFWRHGEPVYRDLDGDDPYDEKRVFPHLACIVDVPFSHGTLAVNSEQRFAFSDADVELLQELAELLGDGFRRLRELQVIDVRLRLREEVWRMRRKDDIVRLLATLRQSFSELGFRFTECGINVVMDSEGEVLVHHMGEDGTWTKMTEGPLPLILKIWRSEQPAYRRDLATEDPFDEYEALADYYGQAIRSVIDVPFSHGTLALNSTEPGAFSDDQVELLQELAEVLEEGFRRLDDLQALEKHNLALQQEVTERRKAEHELERSLSEKVVLLKEVHHRVKNNLQVVSSLLSLRANGIDDPLARSSFQESRAQIESMALIHERLYETQDLARIDCAEYVRALAANVFDSYGADPQRLRLEVSVEPHVVTVDTAIHCGLIVHELVSNSIKYAFPASRTGTVRVQASPVHDRLAKLVVDDDGIGLPSGLHPAQAGTLGLRLVGDLARQMQGTIAIERDPGTTFTIHFPLEP